MALRIHKTYCKYSGRVSTTLVNTKHPQLESARIRRKGLTIEYIDTWPYLGATCDNLCDFHRKVVFSKSGESQSSAKWKVLWKQGKATGSTGWQSSSTCFDLCCRGSNVQPSPGVLDKIGFMTLLDCLLKLGVQAPLVFSRPFIVFVPDLHHQVSWRSRLALP